MAIEVLPDELAISVAALLAASSPDPMQDLRSLRRSCKWMYQVCRNKHVAKFILMQQALERELFVVEHYDRDYRDGLIGKLAEAGNKEACFRDGLRVVFDVNRTELECPLDNLASAADEGHNLVVYTFTMCMYRRNAGAVDDKKAKELIRKLEGEDGPGAAAAGGVTVCQRWMNRACVVARLQSAIAADTYEPPYINNLAHIAKPERGYTHIAGGNCGQMAGMVDLEEFLEFCSEDCRIRFECESFFNKYFW